jgi:hypothetical protein
MHEIIKNMLIIFSGAYRIASENGINVSAVSHYVGCTDCSFISEGASLLQYNVLLEGHKKHKSTLGYKLGW